jgi:hypothetical protein
VRAVIEHRLTTVIHCPEQLELLVPLKRDPSRPPVAVY